MAKTDVILGTVKTMLDSGIDEETIIDTLSDTGISAAEAKKLIAKAKVSNDEPEAAQEMPPRDEKIASKVAEKVQAQLDNRAEEDAMRETAVHAAIEAHNIKLDEVHDDIKELHRKFDDSDDEAASAFSGQEQAGSAAVLSRINKMEVELSELTATTFALRTLLQKILDTNREVLFELQKKK